MLEDSLDILSQNVPQCLDSWQLARQDLSSQDGEHTENTPARHRERGGLRSRLRG